MDHKKEYKKFEKVLVESLKERFDETKKAEIMTVKKTNVGEKKAVCIYDKKSKVNSVSPNIYLDHFFSMYQEGVPMEDIVDEIIEMYEEHRNDVVDFSADDLCSFDKIKNKIIFRILNQELNEHMKRESPHIIFMDLLVIFQIVACEFEGAVGYIRVTNEMMKQWNISLERLLVEALKNSERLYPARLVSLSAVIGQTASECFDYPIDVKEVDYFQKDSEDECINDLLVLTNSKKMNGFGCLMYYRCAQRIAEVVGGDFYILPSSLHEAIILPGKYGIKEPQELLEMVREVNQNMVAPEEFLSDNVYYYSQERDEFVTISNKEGVVSCV